MPATATPQPPEFLLASPPETPSNTDEAPLLAVHQIWRDVVLETRHFAPGQPSVTIGSDLGWRWSILGVQLGWVAAPLARIAPLALPIWSEVEQRLRSDFYAPDDALAGALDHSLFQWDGRGYRAHLWSAWEGWAEWEGQRLPLGDLVDQGLAEEVRGELVVPIIEGLRLFLTLGELSFVAGSVPRSAGILNRSEEGPDWAYLSIFSTLVFAAGLFGVVLWTTPAPPQNEMVEVPERIVELVMATPTPEKREEVVEQTPKGESDAGEPDAPDDTPVAERPERKPGGSRDISSAHDREVVSQAGVFGVWDDDGLAALSGTGLGADLTGAIDAMRGPKRVVIGGGLSKRGGCCGGFGDAEGMDGGLGTHGLGGEDGTWGSEDGLGPRSEPTAFVDHRGVIKMGGLDRALVDEVVKAHMSQIRYCYQRQLPRNPDLAGKVSLKFIIAKDGSVSSATVKASTLDTPEVHKCLTDRFFRMTFPRPKGGIVIVTYPFLFAPG